MRTPIPVLNAPMATYHARSCQRMARVPVWQAQLVAVLEGRKEVRTEYAVHQAEAGQWLVLPAGGEVEVVNLPDPVSGRYLAFTLSQDRQWLTRFHRAFGQLVAAVQSAPVFTPSDDSRVALERLMAALTAPLEGLDLAIAEHSWQGLMLALLRQGQAGALLTLPAEGVALRLQAMFQFEPGRGWTLEDAATRLALSQATLRRRLAEEGKSFSQILTDTRLGLALGQVMTGRERLTDIALACGYQSPSRFAEAFRRRFGVLPSALRASQGLTDTVSAPS